MSCAPWGFRQACLSRTLLGAGSWERLCPARIVNELRKIPGAPGACRERMVRPAPSHAIRPVGWAPTGRPMSRTQAPRDLRDSRKPVGGGGTASTPPACRLAAADGLRPPKGAAGALRRGDPPRPRGREVRLPRRLACVVRSGSRGGWRTRLCPFTFGASASAPRRTGRHESVLSVDAGTACTYDRPTDEDALRIMHRTAFAEAADPPAPGPARGSPWNLRAVRRRRRGAAKAPIRPRRRRVPA